jgi:hypothetical protein
VTIDPSPRGMVPPKAAKQHRTLHRISPHSAFFNTGLVDVVVVWGDRGASLRALEDVLAVSPNDSIVPTESPDAAAEIKRATETSP